MTPAESTQYRGLMHAGAGSGVFLIQASALLPGLLPFVALCAVVLLPLVALGLVGAVLAAPPYAVWRAATRGRRERRRAEGAHGLTPR